MMMKMMLIIDHEETPGLASRLQNKNKKFYSFSTVKGQ